MRWDKVKEFISHTPLRTQRGYTPCTASLIFCLGGRKKQSSSNLLFSKDLFKHRRESCGFFQSRIKEQSHKAKHSNRFKLFLNLESVVLIPVRDLIFIFFIFFHLQGRTLVNVPWVLESVPQNNIFREESSFYLANLTHQLLSEYARGGQINRNIDSTDTNTGIGSMLARYDRYFVVTLTELC